MINKNKFLFFHAIAIVLALSNYTCIAMQPDNDGKIDPNQAHVKVEEILPDSSRKQNDPQNNPNAPIPATRRRNSNSPIPQIPVAQDQKPSTPQLFIDPTAFQDLEEKGRLDYLARVAKERERAKKLFEQKQQENEDLRKKFANQEEHFANEKEELRAQFEDRERQFIAEAKKFTAKVETQEKKIEELEHRPNIQIGTVKSLHPSPVVSEKEAERIAAEAAYIAYKHGWQRKVSHAADQAFWPIVKEQGSHFVTEWRKKRWPTEMEQQNKKLGEFKIKGEKRTLNMNDLDLATKLIAIEQNKRTQEVSEGFADAQMLGQILTNIQILSADQSSKDEKQGKRIDALVQEGLVLQERQLAQFSARIKAQQTKSSENTLFANQLVGRVVAQRKKEEEKDKKQKEQRKLEKELERKKQEEWEKKLKDFLNTRDDD